MSHPPAPIHGARSRLLVLLGPGADDLGGWAWATDRPCLRIAPPERTEASLGNGTDTGRVLASRSWEAGVRGFCVRDRHVAGANSRRRLRSLVGAQGLVVQIVREPVAALRSEVQRARIFLLAGTWTAGPGARSAARLVQLPTAESMYERLLPLLQVERRGRSLTPARGRRIVLDRDELADPRSVELRREIEDWLGSDCADLSWEFGAEHHDESLTEALLLVSAGPIEVEGARFGAGLVRTSELAARPDLVELARVPSIAARVHFRVDDASLALVTGFAEFGRLPRGIRQVLTTTGVCQHRLEEQLLPRWIERTAQIHHMLGDEMPEVSPRLAARLRDDLEADLDRLFALRPTLEERWGMLMHRLLAR